MIRDPFDLTPAPEDPVVVCAIYMAVARAVTLTSTPAAVPPPPLRLGFGTVGERVQVFANHFRVEVEEGHLYHYDVSITPACSSKKINKAVIDELVYMYRLRHVFPVYDGLNSLYTTLPYPFS
ncbi:putative protein argonaute [Rosa chinensis]|uniref:Protein argonaute N-terminal domain-containing protein n=1 Tax=Rosa chinensis TaxID=74649 RepID=A0A2P6SJ89_ROSCH|nr:putative protein argonaute [Rosa chinensis]